MQKAYACICLGGKIPAGIFSLMIYCRFVELLNIKRTCNTTGRIMKYHISATTSC